LRPIEPLCFPATDGEEMGETSRHMALRTALWQAIALGFGERLAVGSDQFVYFNGRDPAACCAPDVFVCLGKAQTAFETWKTWELGTPELAFEIISACNAREPAWDDKLRRYRELGNRELVRFDPDDAARPLRIWDRVDDDLVERDPTDPSFSRCDTLDAYLRIRTDPTYGPWLYLSRDPQGRDPYLTPEEARLRAEARVRELEAELARRG
jgi:hypothetical protein